MNNKKPILFEEAGSDSDVEIKTNNEYATHYDTWRQKEELNKLRTKYGDPNITNDIFNNDETSSSEDDDDGRELTEEFEKDFFKTLSCLKNKDPKIYDENVVFFEDKTNENDPVIKKTKSKKNEPMFLKDYERKMILEKGSKFDDSDEEDPEENPRSNSPTYVEEQRRLKESLQQAVNDGDNDDTDNWGGMFAKRVKTKEEHVKEEVDYKKWLKGNKEQLENKEEESALKPLKEYWNKPDLEDSEKFLRDYFLNKRYLENENENRIPTYEEIIHDSDEGLSEDEKQIEKQEEFEHKYNFRYEEPDQEFIKRYPRTLDHSVRKTDERRKIKRQEIKERKEEEKKQKQEDLKQLKILKRKEIEEKIKKLKEITGNEDMAFQDADLDADFDPEVHDKRMQLLFNDEYYQGQEDDLKPEFSDFEEELGPWRNSNELHCEDDDFVMDADYNPRAAKQRDKKKKRNRPGKLSKNKDDMDELPIDENDERYQEYMDELYNLDCEDMIGDMPCRFKYRDVLPNDFGLTIEEILLAKDKELNRWCSLKKTMQYRPDHMEKYDVIAYKRKAANENLKKKLLPSIYDESMLEEDTEKEKQVDAMYKSKQFADGNNKTERTTKRKIKKMNQHNNDDDYFQLIDEQEEFADHEGNTEFVNSDKDDKKKKQKNRLQNDKKIDSAANDHEEYTTELENDELVRSAKNGKKKKINKHELTENIESLNSDKNDKKKKSKNRQQNDKNLNSVLNDQKENTSQLKNNELVNQDKKGKKKKSRKQLNNETMDFKIEETSNKIEKEDMVKTKKIESKKKITVGNFKRNSDQKVNTETNNQKNENKEKNIENLKENKSKKKRKRKCSLNENQNNNKLDNSVSETTNKSQSKKQMSSNENTTDENNKKVLSRRQKRNKKIVKSKLNSSESTIEVKSQNENRKRKLSEKGDSVTNNPKKQKFNKNKKKQPGNNELSISEARLEAYGINPKKFKNKLKYKNKNINNSKNIKKDVKEK